ncbi:MAD1L1 protein [Thecamonas trahens ATCC 50062]|uniref:MAD1L1 protein n=1 Tax=Thecamonas trahens ATCC 50062 TaxID=461836 RepID=A0A0L0DN45_THETB|nr:MAD1L1 protein [Thecamonas trahens ATCC 50062]KNC53680.1 MAD1L1 protein [Thecamonas trahens ATCC 50062]|eukprot:XP_013761994.1 MAD1L1 protein [Thecamonas trahens ATCC 50062]
MSTRALRPLSSSARGPVRSRKRKLGAPSPGMAASLSASTSAMGGASASAAAAASATSSSSTTAARTLAAVKHDVDRFLSAPDLPGLVVAEQALRSTRAEADDDKLGREGHSLPLPTTLPQAWKLIQRYEMTVGTLKKQIAELSAAADRMARMDELAGSQELAGLRAQLARMATRVEKARMDASEARAGDGDALKQAQIEIEDLKSQRRALMDTLKEAKASAATEAAEAADAVAAAQARESSLAERVAQLESELATAAHAADAAKHDAELAARAAAADKELLNMQIEQVTRERQEASARAAELTPALTRVAELEAELERLRLASSRDADAAADAATLQAELARLSNLQAQVHELERTNTALAAKAQNTALLEERVESLQAAAGTADALRAALADAKAAVARHDEEREAWATLLRERDLLSSFPTPAAIVAHLVELQDTVLHLKSSSSTSSTQLKLKDTHTDALTEQLIHANQQAEMYAAALAEAQAALKRAERATRVASAERDGYKNMLAAYEDDDGEAAEDAARKDESKVPALKAMVSALETQVAELSAELKQASEAQRTALRRAQVAEAQADSVAPAPVPMDLTGSFAPSRSPVKGAGGEAGSGTVAASESELARVREENLVLKAENEKLGAALLKAETLAAKLEAAVGAGSFNAKTTKVLHFKSNPAAAAAKAAAAAQERELDELRAANKALKEALVQQQSGAASPIAPQAPHIAQLRERVNELEVALAQAATKNTRLKEVFAKMSAEFKEVTYLLLGFQIDMKDQGRYRLRSMYAEHKDDVLYFAKSDEGTMHLLETPFAASLGDEVDAYLRRCHSIPAFLSHVTTKLFNSLTVQP